MRECFIFQDVLHHLQQTYDNSQQGEASFQHTSLPSLYIHVHPILSH